LATVALRVATAFVAFVAFVAFFEIPRDVADDVFLVDAFAAIVVFAVFFFAAVFFATRFLTLARAAPAGDFTGFVIRFTAM
jgi:hypothetical protein